MRRLLLLVLSSVVMTSLLGCPIDSDDDDEDSENNDDPDAGPEDTGFPDPRTDLTDRIGAADTLEIAAWNVKNFPCGNPSFSTQCRSDADETPELLADLITSMDLDLVAIEEIADEDAFNETVQRLPEHEGILSTDTYGDGSYQKIGYIYRSTVLSAGTESLLFGGSDAFPRPALQTEFTWTGPGGTTSFLAIAVHLKAGETNDDESRRADAIAQMAAYTRNLVDGSGNDNIVMLGDFNETLDGAGATAFDPFRDDTRYRIRTEDPFEDGEATFIPSGVILDHIVTTAALDAAIGGAAVSATIPRVDQDVSSYRDRLSDHLPVVLKLVSP